MFPGANIAFSHPMTQLGWCFAAALTSTTAQSAGRVSGGVDLAAIVPSYHLDAGLGVSSLGGYIGLSSLVRARWLEGGVGVGHSTALALNPTSRSTATLLAGLGWTSLVGIDVLGEFGVVYHRIAYGRWFGGDPGVSGGVPYLGLRAGINARVAGVPARKTRGSVGLWVYVRSDLDSRFVTYRYDGGFLSRHEDVVTRKLGGTTEFGVYLTGGVDFLP